jgi:transposase
MNEDNPKQRKKNQKYSPQFKDQALERAGKVGVPQAAKDLGISEPLLYAWRAKQKTRGTPLEHQKLQAAEMARLKREVDRLAMENEFLKKVAQYFTKESK